MEYGDNLKGTVGVVWDCQPKLMLASAPELLNGGPGEQSQAALLSILSALPIFCCVFPNVSRMWCSGMIQNLSKVSLIAAFVPSSSSRTARSLAWDILGPCADPLFSAEFRREPLEVFW